MVLLSKLNMTEKQTISLVREYENEVIQLKLTYLTLLLRERERYREMTRIMKISARLWTLVFQRKMELL